eukprot:PhM_4_TR12833/c0_g1_i1/m.5151
MCRRRLGDRHGLVLSFWWTQRKCKETSFGGVFDKTHVDRTCGRHRPGLNPQHRRSTDGERRVEGRGPCVLSVQRVEADEHALSAAGPGAGQRPVVPLLLADEPRDEVVVSRGCDALKQGVQKVDEDGGGVAAELLVGEPRRVAVHVLALGRWGVLAVHGLPEWWDGHRWLCRSDAWCRGCTARRCLAARSVQPSGDVFGVDGAVLRRVVEHRSVLQCTAGARTSHQTLLHDGHAAGLHFGLRLGSALGRCCCHCINSTRRRQRSWTCRGVLPHDRQPVIAVLVLRVLEVRRAGGKRLAWGHGPIFCDPHGAVMDRG